MIVIAAFYVLIGTSHTGSGMMAREEVQHQLEKGIDDSIEILKGIIARFQEEIKEGRTFHPHLPVGT